MKKLFFPFFILILTTIDCKAVIIENKANKNIVIVLYLPSTSTRVVIPMDVGDKFIDLGNLEFRTIATAFFSGDEQINHFTVGFSSRFDSYSRKELDKDFPETFKVIFKIPKATITIIDDKGKTKIMLPDVVKEYQSEVSKAVPELPHGVTGIISEYCVPKEQEK